MWKKFQMSTVLIQNFFFLKSYHYHIEDVRLLSTGSWKQICTSMYGTVGTSVVDPDRIKSTGRIRIRIRIHIIVISWIRIRIDLQMTSQTVWNKSLFEHFFKVLSLCLERMRLRIRIKVKIRIRIRIKVMRIRNTGRYMYQVLHNGEYKILQYLSIK